MCIGTLRFTCGWKLHFNLIDDFSDQAIYLLGHNCKGSGCRQNIDYVQPSQPCGRDACCTCQGNKNVGKGPAYQLVEQDPKFEDLEGTPKGMHPKVLAKQDQGIPLVADGEETDDTVDLYVQTAEGMRGSRVHPTFRGPVIDVDKKTVRLADSLPEDGGDCFVAIGSGTPGNYLARMDTFRRRKAAVVAERERLKIAAETEKNDEQQKVMRDKDELKTGDDDKSED